jgi:hypothetical protein
VRFQVLVASSPNMTAFRDISSCILVEVDRRFRGAYCLHIRAMIHLDVGGSIPETSASFFAITPHIIP